MIFLEMQWDWNINQGSNSFCSCPWYKQVECHIKIYTLTMIPYVTITLGKEILKTKRKTYK